MGPSKFCARVVRPIAASQLNSVIAASHGSHETVFVKFASAFCDACKQSRIAIDMALKRTQKCVNIVELDSDIADATADGFHVKALPTVIAIKDGKVVGKVEAALEAAGYQKFFEKHTG